MNNYTKKRLFNNSGDGGSGSAIVVTEFNPSIVISQTNTPAVGPASGDAYLVGTSPTGVWVGHANEGAIWNGVSYDYTTPVTDDIVYVTSLLQTLRYNGSAWVPYAGTAILQGGNNGIGNVVIGSNDIKELHLKTNGIPRVKIGTGGTVTTTSNIGVGTTSPHASSMLDVTSTTKGLLLPRMTTVQKNAIATPTAGLIVYDTTLGLLQFYTGSVWKATSSLEDIIIASGGNTGSQTLTSANGDGTMYCTNELIGGAYNSGTVTSDIGASYEFAEIFFFDDVVGGFVQAKANEVHVNHSTLIRLNSPLINIPTIQTGNSGLSTGDLYIDTAANILANGDLILARKV